MSEITEYLNQTLTRKSKTGFDEQGKTSLNSGVNFKGRFREKQKKIIDYKGNEYMTDGEVWTEPNQDMNLDDLIVYSGVNYKVVKIDTPRDLGGEIHHKKIFVIKTI